MIKKTVEIKIAKNRFKKEVKTYFIGTFLPIVFIFAENVTSL